MIRPSRLTHGIRSSRWFQTRESRPRGLSTRAISGSARSWSNQWKACALTTTSYDESPAGISSAGACETRTSGRFLLEDGQHLRVRLGRVHVVAEGDQLLGQLAGAGAELEDASSGCSEVSQTAASRG